MNRFLPKYLYRLVIILFILQLTALPQIATGQAEVKVECGSVIEGEFGKNVEEHIYLLTMAPGESSDNGSWRIFYGND